MALWWLGYASGQVYIIPIGTHYPRTYWSSNRHNAHGLHGIDKVTVIGSRQ